MRFMLIVKASQSCEAGKPLSQKASAAIAEFTEGLNKAGVLVELSRLEPSSQGARVKISGQKRTVVDGPFAETKELIGGYWVIEVQSMQEAVAWAKRVPDPHGDGQESEIEIRQFLETLSFTPSGAASQVEAEKEFAKAKK
jgi:hypothetical protein